MPRLLPRQEPLLNPPNYDDPWSGMMCGRHDPEDRRRAFQRYVHRVRQMDEAEAARVRRTNLQRGSH